MMFLPHRKHTCSPPQPVTRIALLFYTLMMFVPHRKHAYGSPRPVTEITLLFSFVDDVLTSQETGLWVPTACYKDSRTVYTLMMFVPLRKSAYGSPRPVTEITLLFSFVDVLTSQETGLWASTTCSANSFTCLCWHLIFYHPVANNLIPNVTDSTVVLVTRLCIRLR
jgi:hypothetical protein